MKIFFQILFQIEKEKISFLIERFGSETGLKDRLRDIVIRIINDEYETAKREQAENEISKDIKL
jgi:hypothetical protein